MTEQAEDGFLQGLENDKDGLQAIGTFGFLRATEIGLFLWGTDENSQKYGQRICRKWLEKGYVIRRELPSKAGGAFVLATAGVRFLAEKGIEAKSGKDWGMMKNGEWSPPRAWKHHVIANGFLALKSADGHEVFSENDLRQMGLKGKLPDGIYTNKSSAFWIEVENQRKTGPNMAAMVNKIVEFSTSIRTFKRKTISPVVVYCENSKDERGFSIDHKTRVLNAIASITKKDIAVRFAKLKMNGLSIIDIEEDLILIDSDRVSAELKMLKNTGTIDLDNEIIYLIGDERFIINKKDFTAEFKGNILKFSSLTDARRAAAGESIKSTRQSDSSISVKRKFSL